MTDVSLTDDQWTKIRDFLRQDPNTYVGKDEQACRSFVEAVKWMSRSDAEWRLLPAEHGVSINDSCTGARQAFGNECWLILPPTRIW